MSPARRDAVALTFALLFPVCMAWLYFLEFAGEGEEANRAMVAVFSLAKVVQFSFPALYVLWFERERLRLSAPTTRGLALGVGFGLLVGVAMFALYLGWLRDSGLADAAPAQVWRRVIGFRAGTPLRYLLLGAAISVVHSFMEEYYWRWFVFGWLRKYLPLAGAVALSSVGFMLHHVVVLGFFFTGQFWTLAVPFSACVAVGGAFWAWLYDRTGSLYAPWVSHILVDAAIFAVGYVMLEGYWNS